MKQKNVPKNTKINNTLLAKKIQYNGSYNEEYAIQPLKDKSVYTTFSLYFDEAVEFSNPIDRFDAEVMNSMASLVVGDVTNQTLHRIGKELIGNTGKDVKVPLSLLKDIENSIKKLSGTKIRIDCTDEFRNRKLFREEGAKRVVIEGRLLNVISKEIYYNNNSKDIEYYVSSDLQSSIPIYFYADQTRQIINIPQNLLEAEGVVRNTKENVLLKRILLTKIEIMKNNRNSYKSNKIFYFSDGDKLGLFDECGIKAEDYTDSSWRKKKTVVRDTIKKLLNYYISQGHILSFEECMSEVTNTYDGIIINFAKNNEENKDNAENNEENKDKTENNEDLNT